MPRIIKRRNAARGRIIESLEARALLSAVSIETLTTDAPDTLDQSVDLGTFTVAEVVGKIDRNGSDVDWYAFTLSAASTVTFESAGGELSLYNDVAGNYSDALGNIGQRRLAQASTDGQTPATLTRDLAAGRYYVAISGSGNVYFHPMIENSGIPGEAGDYTLNIEATSIDTSVSSDPLVLSVDATPLGVRLDLSGSLAFNPVVQLKTAGNANIAVASVRQILGGTELQIVPGAPLAPGSYNGVVKDSLGAVRLSFSFNIPVAAGETGTQGNDKPATSIDLGNLGLDDFRQVAGIVGDDPYYQFSRSNPALYAGNDVDLYHFHISSSSPVGLQAEVFAGRIGSGLDVGISIYRVNPNNGSLVYVTGNNQSYNPLITGDNLTPLLTDPVVMTSLTAGDYYVAVSHGWNTASSLEYQQPGPGSGIPNPASAHSGTNGSNVGPYVLNLQVVPLGAQPQVTSVSIAEQSTLPEAPGTLTVKFDQYMNLGASAFASYIESAQASIAGVFFRDAQGHTFFPRFVEFDPTTFEAHFVMNSRIPAGNYELHLRGSQGVVNGLGRPLAGNSSSGDYVVHFSVAANSVGTNGNPLLWTHDPQSDVTGDPQDLGTLFANELLTGVNIVRNALGNFNAPGDLSDGYQFQILKSGLYDFQLTGVQLPSGISLDLLDGAGQPVSHSSVNGGRTMVAFLQPGTYMVDIGGWPASVPSGFSYNIRIKVPTQTDNAPPLWSGPAPSVGMQLSGIASPTPGGGGGSSGSGSSGTVGGGRPSSGSTGSVISGGSGVDGGSSISTSTATTRGYLLLPAGSSNSSLTSVTDNIAIVPTQTANYQTTVGGGLSAARLTRRGESSRNALRPSNLDEMADGPLGKQNKVDRVREKLFAGERFRDLFQSAIATNQNSDEPNPQVANDAQSPNRTAGTQEDAATNPEAQAVTADEVPANDTNVTNAAPAEKFEQNASLLLDAISMSLNPHSAIGKAATPRYTDKVFAAGLGLLLSQIGVPGVANSTAVRTAGTTGSRSAVGRRTHKRHQILEESAS